ncbi:MAG: hypothetical protein JNJ54_01805 [Myxococcaceae bacterium]|nr:hypothetical protein [Myxococcaceae bacterium]
MRLWWWGYAACVIVAGCRCDDEPGALPDSATVTRPAPPAVRAVLPPALAASLPRTDGGLPILYSNPGEGRATFALVFDESLDDPIARWGECVDRVVACFRVNPSAPVAPCVAQLERCTDASGGRGCCPARCLDEFASATSRGVAALDALDETVLEGTCVEGFRAQVDAELDAGVDGGFP